MDTDKILNSEESEIPHWHKDILKQRIEYYKENPEIAMDFDQAMEEIEKEL